MNKVELVKQLKEGRKKARDLEQSFEALLEAVETGSVSDDLIDQHKSVMTPRRHCAVVRLRMARGLPGATKVGRLYLLTAEAYREECGLAETHRTTSISQPNSAETEAAYQAFRERMET